MYPVNTTKLQDDIKLVEAVNKPLYVGEYDWVGGTTANLASMFQVIEESPVVMGDSFWSQFGHNAPDCTVGTPSHPTQPFPCPHLPPLEKNMSRHGTSSKLKCGLQTYVDHSDGLALQYGNPNNTANQNSRIQLIRKHFIAMSQGRDIAAGEPLPNVPCPAPTSPVFRKGP